MRDNETPIKSREDALNALREIMEILEKELRRLENMSEEEFKEIQRRRWERIKRQYPGKWIYLFYLKTFLRRNYYRIRFFLDRLRYMRSVFFIYRIMYMAKLRHKLFNIKDYLVKGIKRVR